MSAAALIDLSRERAYLRDLGRAFGGALVFSIPLLMTMEMWEQGVAMDRGRLLAFIVAGLPLLYGLAYYAGFSDRRGLANDLMDTAVALAVGFLTAGVLLSLFGVVRWGDPPREALGRIALQAVPGAMGALLARRQLSGDADGGETQEDQASYVGELFLMAAGALFFALNVAPTEEMILIAYKAGALNVLGLMGVSILLLHLIVFRAGFAGQEEADRPAHAFFHFTLPGYAIALGVSLFALFVFGRIEGHSLAGVVQAMAVLGFPAAIGAAAARLLV
ncbi:TIGR02587 family membrane protein [Brevundimonas aurantiaca]|jgi:putative integral membrane protein (TIGR02587 family)|uniref:Putative integral membrane protein (TIGR02587 family) n=1 Tax=Brevundimonas aurantiaca TaxID=74316 RepID=A0A7W9C904_9CAUL|nr:TIGR02587 family membrane protein [Brevundimonas aurantiaca]MBB5741185.1 putative integral membrane protein (TIGR02587 family) [Brevundimonas aurantiaca]